MRKSFKAASVLLALVLLCSMVFTPALASAATEDPTVITCDDFDAASTLALNARASYDVGLSNEDASLTVQSSDDSVVKASLEADSENPGYYTLVLEAWKAGEASVTLTTSDGVSKARDITVEDTGDGPDFTESSDTTSDFSLPANNSCIVKIHYESDNLNTITLPTLVSDNESVIHTEMVKEDFDNNDFYFRVDAAGSNGKSATLSMGSSDYLQTQKLCSVTIADNKNLRIDTQSTYVCNVNDTYSFMVYTNSSSAPVVTTSNDLLSLDSAERVDGGYKYVIEANDTGDSLVQVVLGDEVAGFAVTVNYDDPPSVVTSDPKEVELHKGDTYTYHFAIMGGGAPQFVTDPLDAVAVQSVQKDGINYSCTVVANGAVGSTSELSVTFPDSGDDSFTVDAGKITVTQQPGTYMASDTNNDFTLGYGKSYLFRITGATSFYAGSDGAFKIEKVSKSGNDTFYRITATGKPGSAAGFYMSAADRDPVKVCVVTVGNVAMTSDTTSNFSLAKGASYQYKITAPGIANASDIHFTAGSSGVLQTVFVTKSGNDFYYRITATGNPGQQTGIYVSVLDQAAQKINVVTVKSIAVTSDTNSDFSLAKGKSYQFKITAPGASTVNFVAGSSGVVSVAYVSHSGNDFYFKIAAVGKSGQTTGIYASVPGQTANKICAVTVK